MVTQEVGDRSNDKTEIPYCAHWKIALNVPLDDLYQLKCNIAIFGLGVRYQGTIKKLLNLPD